MDRNWLKEQTHELELALAKQGFSGNVPAVVDKHPPQATEKGEERLNIARFIDHTLLKPDASRLSIKKLCEEALEHSFKSVCINPVHVSYAAELLAGSPVKVCTVIGFPLGASTTLMKVMEAQDALANGAQELDMVINIGALVE